MRNAEQPIRQAIEWLQAARSAVALTGAGLSTPSGIPDFRSPHVGLWQRADPFEVADVRGFRRNPQAFYDWIGPLVRQALKARPNAAHRALAQLERAGRLRALITQNIDDLHERAGSRMVHALHGHMREMHCLACGREYDGALLLRDFLQHGQLPFCDCGRVLKPKVVLFGELLPREVLTAAQVAAAACDLMIVAGSSLEVHPAADLPLLAQRAGARLIIVNLSPTPLDETADLVLRGNVVDVLPRLAAACAP